MNLKVSMEELELRATLFFSNIGCVYRHTCCNTVAFLLKHGAAFVPFQTSTLSKNQSVRAHCGSMSNGKCSLLTTATAATGTATKVNGIDHVETFGSLAKPRFINYYSAKTHVRMSMLQRLWRQQKDSGLLNRGCDLSCKVPAIGSRPPFDTCLLSAFSISIIRSKNIMSVIFMSVVS